MLDKKQTTWELFNSTEEGRRILSLYPNMTKESLDKLDSKPRMSENEFIDFQKQNKHKFKNLFTDDTNTNTPT